MDGFRHRLNLLKGNRTIKEFSRILDIPVSTLHYYLNGREPSLSFLVRVCSKLNVSEEWLISGRGPIYRTEKEHDVLEELEVLFARFLSEKWRVWDKREKMFFDFLVRRLFPEFEHWLANRS